MKIISIVQRFNVYICMYDWIHLITMQMQIYSFSQRGCRSRRIHINRGNLFWIFGIKFKWCFRFIEFTKTQRLSLRLSYSISFFLFSGIDEIWLKLFLKMWHSIGFVICGIFQNIFMNACEELSRHQMNWTHTHQCINVGIIEPIKNCKHDNAVYVVAQSSSIFVFFRYGFGP